jgi:hypothetical protein
MLLNPLVMEFIDKPGMEKAEQMKFSAYDIYFAPALISSGRSVPYLVNCRWSWLISLAGLSAILNSNCRCCACRLSRAMQWGMRLKTLLV